MNKFKFKVRKGRQVHIGRLLQSLGLNFECVENVWFGCDLIEIESEYPVSWETIKEAEKTNWVEAQK